MTNSTRHQTAHAKIQHHIGKAQAERLDPAHKLGGAAPTLQTFDPPIPKPTQIAPDQKLKARIQHGS